MTFNHLHPQPDGIHKLCDERRLQRFCGGGGLTDVKINCMKAANMCHRHRSADCVEVFHSEEERFN